jgi:hypothetical protein
LCARPDPDGAPFLGATKPLGERYNDVQIHDNLRRSTDEVPTPYALDGGMRFERLEKGQTPFLRSPLRRRFAAPAAFHYPAGEER